MSHKSASPFFSGFSPAIARSCREFIGHTLGSAGGYAPPDPRAVVPMMSASLVPVPAVCS